MERIKPIIGLLLCVALALVGSTRIGSIPPIGKFFDPFHGFWQNAEPIESNADLDFSIDQLSGQASVVMDERGVPHVFAASDHDLFFLQGYLTAKDRLWQMEFQTHAAAGRISEIVGDKAKEFDMEQRRIGMLWSAERALEFVEQDSLSRSILNAYTAGVNAFIDELQPRDLPVEYKLLDYKPERWTNLKSTLLLKYMAKMLTGTERDRPNAEALKLLGTDLFNELFPEQTKLNDPIVPSFSVDSSVQSEPLHAWIPSSTWETPEIQPHFIGSNNWAVSAQRTAFGKTILCNDPHLKLSLPSIWYEIQLHGPSVNCYGVSLPGAPNVIIGFNKNIAWGVTNAGRDVQDYYQTELNADRTAYRFGNDWKQVQKRVETVVIRGQEPVVDTVLYTHLGPIAYQDDEHDSFLALRWLAHDPSNEMITFYGLNRADDFEDYQEALVHYECPGQNFVFADANDNIAIWQQGKFPLKPNDHGKFILDGTDPKLEIDRFIPQQQNPHVLNPERGFVSSANQAPTDTTYPYYYTGVFEEFRNRTINRALRADSSITVQDMMDLQLNNYNLLAEEALPLMLELLDTNRFQYPKYERLALKELLAWNYRNDAGIIAPTVFEIWWDELNALLWDEFNGQEWDQDMYYRYSWQELLNSGKARIDMRDPRYVYPMAMVTIEMLRSKRGHQMFDHHYTNDKKETAADIVYDSFYWMSMKFGDIIKYKFSQPHWGYYQATTVQHLMRLDAFSSPKLFVGGSENAPNATTSTHGPSWRMIVELNADGPTAYGVLPGGQSGNPGSANYMNSLELWAKGEYHRLKFLGKPEEADEKCTVIKFKAKE